MYSKNCGNIAIACMLLGFIQACIAPNNKPVEVPEDYVLLKQIFGKYDADSTTFTRPRFAGEPTHVYFDSVKFSVTFKKQFTLDQKPRLLVICQALVGRLHFHTFILIRYYYFEPKNGQWKLSRRFGENADSWVDDTHVFKLMETGKNKTALVSIYNHAGNSHMAEAYTLHHLAKDSIRRLGRFELSYSNKGWVGIETPAKQACTATSYSSTFEVLRSDKEWYDIKVLKKHFRYTRGCKNAYVDSREKLLYRFNGKEYIVGSK